MIKRIFLLILVVSFIILFPTVWISISTSGKIYRDFDSVPENRVGLLLGTSEYTAGGGENLFFTTRMEAAFRLYSKNKIKHIIASGDNSDISYNEPRAMMNALQNRGIPESAITLDYAGFRTLDSVIRAKKIFGTSTGITIISQPFHLERALYIAKANGINAIGFGAANISWERGARVYVREIGARFIAFFEVLFGAQPTTLGEKIQLPI